jgi:uncharacterized protein with PIN domain
MPEPRFLLDGMLGSLARWLRILGYDARYARDLPDRELLSLLSEGDRVLLTRDRQLAARAGERGEYLGETDLDAQLAFVVTRFQLELDRRPSRCTACNGRLRIVDRASVRQEVNEGTYDGHRDFWRCEDCGKVYWQGAHWKNIRRRLERLSTGPGSTPR